MALLVHFPEITESSKGAIIPERTTKRGIRANTQRQVFRLPSLQ
jgi:hypothetical protein